MSSAPRQISLEQWAPRRLELLRQGMREPNYGGPIQRHVTLEGDLRLRHLRYDDSAASLRLWNFLLSENDRLREARQQGKLIVGAMKDLGTVPVMAYTLPQVVAFYPDGAWWIPCLMECGSQELAIADRMGIDEAFCPVRAMLGAFDTLSHFPAPHLLICSAGATCDDFSAIAQRLEGMGWPIFWWEIPSRRAPSIGEVSVDLPGGFRAAAATVVWVRAELGRVRKRLEQLAGRELTDEMLKSGIAAANRVRRLLGELRRLVFTADRCPLPALETLITEMLAIHYCSDREETLAVLTELLGEVRRRVAGGTGTLPADAVRVFWVNPVADLRVMNLLEACGGRLCGTDFMFFHALEIIPEELEPMEALARMALADPMVGSSAERAGRICRDAVEFAAEAVVISRIPGASHCAWEGAVIRETISARLDLPVVEIEVPSVSDPLSPALQTRLEALMEAARARRSMRSSG